MDTVKLIRLFVSIAETGSLSAVARSWGVTPSTVTLGLKQLETHLGTQLVFRTTRQLSLTQDGIRFLDRSRRLLADLDDVLGEFTDEGPLSGHIRMTATNDLGRERLAPLIDDFMKRHPGMTVQLFLSDSLVDLVEGGFDIGIRTGPLQDSDLKARLLLRGHKCVCAAPDYWRRHGKPAHPSLLSGHNCLVLGSPGETQAFWSFRENGRALRVRVSGSRLVNDGQTLRHWAVAGAGVVMKSSFDVTEDLEAGRLETALETFTADSTNLYAVTPPGDRAPKRVAALLDFLSDRLS